MRRWISFLTIALLAPATAAADGPCLPRFADYGDPGIVVTCTCGPPQGLTLGLGELTEELGVEPPKFPGTLEQTIGALYGTWTYGPTSNVCKAAMHAGLFETMEVGGRVTLAGTAGCARYESTWQNDWQSREQGPADVSFYFPDLTLGRCPDEDGYASKYQGPPAYELLKTMLGRSLRLSHGALDHPLLERFGVERLVLAPQGGPPVLVESLRVQALDMENLSRRFPPRYLLLEARGIVLPTVLLGPTLAAALGTPRVTLNAALELRYTLQTGRLTLNRAEIELPGLGTLWLRGEVLDLKPTVLNDPQRGPLAARPNWVRLRLTDGGLAARLLDPALLGTTLTTAPGGVRAEALRSQLLAWLRDLDLPPAPLELYLQPAEGSTLAGLLALAGDAEALATAARLAARYAGPPLEAHLPPTGTPRITLPDPAPSARERLVVRFAGLPGGADEWIAVSYVGTALYQYEQYRSLDGAREGEVSFGGLAPGFYEVRALGRGAGGGTELLALSFLLLSP